MKFENQARTPFSLSHLCLLKRPKKQIKKGRKNRHCWRKSKCSCEQELYLLQNQPHVLANIDEFYHLRLLLPTQDAEWPHHLGEGLTVEEAWHMKGPSAGERRRVGAAHRNPTHKLPLNPDKVKDSGKRMKRQMREGRKDYFLFRMSSIDYFFFSNIWSLVILLHLLSFLWYFWTKIWWKLAWMI